MVYITDPQRLHLETPLGASTALHSSYLEPLHLLNFDFDADPGPTFALDAVSDLAFHSGKASDHFFTGG
jgi:hypothetical protein